MKKSSVRWSAAAEARVGNPGKIAQAVDELGDGDIDAGPGGDLDQAVQHYRKAFEKANDA